MRQRLRFTVVLASLLYGSESGTPYQSQINQLDAIPKSCLRSIYVYTPQDKISNSSLFAKCNVGDIEIFFTQSRLRSFRYFIQMIDDRFLKILSCHDENWNVRRLYLKYRDKLQNNLIALSISVDIFEQLASICKNWKVKCHKVIKYLSIFRRWGIMYLINIFRTIVLVFVSMFITTFRPLYAPAFFRWLECRT